MRTAALALITLIVASRISAQEVRGIVVEDDTGSPIAGVTVELLANDSTVRAAGVTTAAGWFQLSVGPEGQHFLRVSHTLYTTSGNLAFTASRREIVNVVIRMGRATIPLQPLVVTARSHDRMSGFRERASGHGMGRYILRPEIERRRPFRPTDLFKLESGVRLERMNVQGVPVEVLTMRSFGEECEPAIYIDGLPLPSRLGTSMTSIDDVLTVEQLEGIEIYRSGATAPLELHVPTDNCGVIAIWTRPIRNGRVSWKRLGIAALLTGVMFFVLR